jgi:uncharacterized protein (UPF0335 family)
MIEPAPIGDNSGALEHSPEPMKEHRAEAARNYYARLRRLNGERKNFGDTIRELKADAKANGVPREAVDLALKLDRITAEKRADLATAYSLAFQSFGYSWLEPASAEVRHPLMWEYIATIQAHAANRREVAGPIKELNAEMVQAGFKPEAFSFLIKLERLDGTDRADFLHEIDSIAAFFGFW